MIVVSIILIIIGLLLRYWACVSLKENFQLIIQPPTKIVTTGAYRFMKHPSYYGSMLLIIGASLIHPVLGITIISWGFFKSRMVVEDEIIRRMKNGL